MTLLRARPRHLACRRADYARVRQILTAVASTTSVHVLPSDEVPADRVVWLDLPDSSTACPACQQDRADVRRILGGAR